MMLPKGWTHTSVADACETVSVGIVVNPSSYYVNAENGIRAFRSGNVRENKVNDSNWVFLSEEGHKKNKKSALKAGDVLVVRTGFAGTACVVPAEYEGSNCIDVLFARPNRALLLSEYLCQLTNSELGRQQVFSGQSGLAQKHLNVSSYEKMRFRLPPIDEQHRIADILIVWDNAIAATERLLANSRKQRQILAQQVLQGARRLNKFENTSGLKSTPYGPIPTDWSYPRIGAVAEELSIKHSSGPDFPVLSCTKHGGLVDSLQYFKKRVFSEDLSSYKIAPRGSFVYATNHIEEGSIGYQDLYEHGCVSPMYTVFKTHGDVDDGYLYRLLKTEHYRQIFAASTNSSVDRRGSLRWKDFQRIHIPLPPIAQQHAIVELLDHADRDTELIRRQLNSLRAEKAALMQQLLTGKRRVRIPKAIAKAA
jgi:type I restriction enzyme S subunit